MQNILDSRPAAKQRTRVSKFARGLLSGNLLPRSYRVTEMYSHLAVEGLGTRLAKGA